MNKKLKHNLIFSITGLSIFGANVYAMQKTVKPQVTNQKAIHKDNKNKSDSKSKGIGMSQEEKKNLAEKILKIINDYNLEKVKNLLTGQEPAQVQKDNDGHEIQTEYDKKIGKFIGEDNYYVYLKEYRVNNDCGGDFHVNYVCYALNSLNLLNCVNILEAAKNGNAGVNVEFSKDNVEFSKDSITITHANGDFLRLHLQDDEKLEVFAKFERNKGEGVDYNNRIFSFKNGTNKFTADFTLKEKQN